MYLFFDTETTGLPKKWDAPADDLHNWPRIIQIAWVEQDKDGRTISTGDYLVKPDGFDIPEESTRIHRITNEIANERGYPLRDVLEVFNALMKKSKYLVAHNLFFDQMVLGAEFKREYMKSNMDEVGKICTMTESVEFANIPGRSGLKYPGLAEIYFKLFNTNFDEAHDASADIAATAKCFWELKNKGVIDINNLTPIESGKKDTGKEEDTSSDNMSMF